MKVIVEIVAEKMYRPCGTWRSSVAEPEPEPYHFDPRRTGTVSLL
jgi:hypothetical protein